MRLPNLKVENKQVVAAATILAILLSVVFADWFVKMHRRPASTSASAAHTAPAHVDTPQPNQVQFHYAIQKGDRMWFLAKASCGNALRYRDLATANGIPNPDWIVAGKDVLTVLPQGCKAVFTPKRARMAHHVRSAIADSDTDAVDAEAPAIQWHVPAFDRYTWPSPFSDFAQQYRAGTETEQQPAASNAADTITAEAPSQVSQATTTPTTPIQPEGVPAPKGRIWYVIHLNSANGLPMPLKGTWQALLVKDHAQPKAKDVLKYRTGVVVTPTNQGVNVFVQLQHAPSPKEALLFLDGNGQRFRLRGHYMVANGEIAGTAPAALPRIVPGDYSVIEKVFPVAQNRFSKIVSMGGPLAINTAIGFAIGGPIGVVITDGVYEGITFLHHKQHQAAERLQEAQP